MSRGTTASHIARAAIESIAYQTADVLRAMEADAGVKIQELRVDGGATANNILMQFQANLLNCKVNKPKVVETTALGAAYLAGLATGYWKDIAEIQQLWESNKVFEAEPPTAETEKGFIEWKRAISATQSWSNS
jgi:glycerol kinase